MPTLGYWKNKGLAQPIRLLLTYAGVEFEDVQYGQGPPPDFSRESWYSVKPKFGEFLSFPNWMYIANVFEMTSLPYYIDGDVKISQSHAILRHVARKYKLDGETEKEKAVVDMIIEEAMDLRNNIYKITYTSVENYEKLKPDFFKNLPPKLKQFENHLGVNDWFAWDAITAADFSMYDLLDFLRRLQSDCLNAFPKLQSFLERFESLPKVKEYLSLDKVKNLPRSSKIAVRTF